ncbi:MAG: PAS domain S-box protein, partial [Candidatus Omnitrophica bacterium]|nr:PAS domain S-box protein [Candidatus Omnitrophota bacterium]
MIFRRKRKSLWLISLIIIITFLFSSPGAYGVFSQEVGRDTIAAQSVFSPLTDLEIKDIAMLEYSLASGINSGSVDVFSEISHRNAASFGVDLSSEETKIAFSFDRAEYFHTRGIRLVPCSISRREREREYLCCLISDPGSDKGFRAVFLSDREKYRRDFLDRVSKLRNEQREEALAISRAVRSEFAHDEKIRDAIRRGNYARLTDMPVSGKRKGDIFRKDLFLVYSFLDIVCPELSRDLSRLVSDGRLMVITEYRKGEELTEPHAGGKGIYLPNKTKFMGERTLAGTVVHEVFAKAGFAHSDAAVMQKIFTKFRDYYSDRYMDTPGSFPVELVSSLDPSEKGLLARARSSEGFVDLEEYSEIRDFSSGAGLTSFSARYRNGSVFTDEQVEDIQRAIGDIKKLENFTGVDFILRNLMATLQILNYEKAANFLRLLSLSGRIKKAPDHLFSAKAYSLFLRYGKNDDWILLPESVADIENPQMLPSLVHCLARSAGLEEQDVLKLERIFSPEGRMVCKLSGEEKDILRRFIADLKAFRKDIETAVMEGRVSEINDMCRDFCSGLASLCEENLDNLAGHVLNTFTIGFGEVESAEKTEEGTPSIYKLVNVDLKNGFATLGLNAYLAGSQGKGDELSIEASKQVFNAFDEESEIGERYYNALRILDTVAETGKAVFLFNSYAAGDSRKSFILDVVSTLAKGIEYQERKFHGFWDTITVGVHVIAPDGTVKEVNPYELKMLGYRREEMIGRKIWDFVVPDQREEVKRRIEARTEGLPLPPRSLDRFYLKKDGSTMIVSTSDIAIRNDEGDIVEFRTVMRDITKYRQAEEMTRMILEKLPSAVFFKEYDEEEDVFRFKYVNSSFYALLGLDPVRQNIEGLTEYEVRRNFAMGPDYQAEWYDRDDRRIFSGADSLYRKEEEMGWGEDRISVSVQKKRLGDGVLGVFTDISKAKQAEAGLKRSEEMLRHLFEAMMDGFAYHEVVVDGNGKPVDSVFKEINSVFEEMTGKHRDEVVGRRMKEVFPEIEDHWVEMFGNVALTGDPVRTEQYFATLGRWYSVSVYCPESGHFAVMFEDITEKKRVRENMAYLSAVVENTDDIICVKDLEHRVVACNEAFLGLVGPGTEKTDVLGKTDREIFAGLLEPGIIKQYMEDEKKASYGQLVKKEEQGVGGRIMSTCKFPIIAGGEIIATANITRDITEAREAEERMQEAEAMKAKLMGLMPLPMIVWEMESQKCVDANEKALELYGYTLEEFRELSPQDLRRGNLRPDEKALKELSRQKLGSERGGAVPVESDQLKKDGSSFLAEMTVFNFEQSGRSYLVHIVNDVTEERKREEELATYRAGLEKIVEERTRELEEAQKQMSKSERLAALGQMSAGIVHEIKNPLANAAAMIRQVINTGNTDKLDAVLKELERGVDITRDLLDYSRERKAAFEPVYLRGILEEAVEKAWQTIEESGVKVSIEAEEAVPVEVERKKILRVFINLIENACHAMSRTAEKDLTITLKADVAGKRTVVEVRDTGEGIPEEVSSRIFDPFFTTKSSGKGTGLGLFLVEKIVHDHGGQIEVSSLPGEGTVFSVALPLSDKVPSRESGPATETEFSAQDGLREIDSVLILDDQREILKMWEKELEGSGIAVILCDNVAEALNLVKSISIAAVITDVKVPSAAEGLSFAVTLRNKGFSGPICAATNFERDPRIAKLMEENI